MGGVSRLERLRVDCLSTISFARTNQKSPLILCDNHNIVDPTWWDFDSGFLAVRTTFKLSTRLPESGLPSVAVLMVLRPRMTDYTDQDIHSISKLLRTSTSDLWMIPYDMAGEYKQRI